MKRIAIGIFAASICVTSVQAEAYHVTCNDFAVLNGVSVDSCEDENGDGLIDAVGFGLATGAIFGVVDTLAALLCLGRHPACDCAQSVLFDRPDEYFGVFFVEFEDCVTRNPDDAILGPALKAAQAVCDF